MKNTVLSLILFLFSSVVVAGPYVSGGVGKTDYDYDNAIVNTLFDDSATAISLAVGYNWSHISGELEYTDFGDADRSFGMINTKFNAKAVTIWAVKDWHVWHIGGMNVDLGLRVGFSKIDADAAIGAFSVSDSDTGFAYGVQTRLHINHHSSIDLSYRKRDASFDVGFGSFDYDPSVVQLNYTYTF